MEKYIGKFIGPDKIEEVLFTEQRTPNGGVVFELRLSNGTTVIMPEKGLVAVVSDEAKDHNHVRDARVNMMVPEIVKIIEEYDLPVTQVVHLLQSIGSAIDNRFARAMNWMWTRNDKRFVPGFSPENDATVLMAERVIGQIPHEPTE